MVKNRLLMFLPAVLMGITLHAFEVNGIFYEITDESAKTVEVTLADYESSNADYYYGDITIPSRIFYYGEIYNVTSIASCAFHDCINLTSITIPSSVTSIGEFAFELCSSLRIVKVNNPTPVALDEYQFPNRSDIYLYVPVGSYEAYETANVWNEFRAIGEWSSSAIEFLDNNVKAICVSKWDTNGDGELDINEAASVTYLSGFDNNKQIVCFDELKYFTGLREIRTNQFYNCSNLEIITLPDGVTSIGGTAFFGCVSLKSIIIPQSVTSIGYQPLLDCTGLTSISVQSGNIHYDSRENCNAIIETETNTLIAGCNNTLIPNSVTIIGTSAFSHCMEMTSLTIPEAVTNIGDYAFYNCAKIESVEIPDNVSSIGQYAFWHCDKLSTVIIGKSVANIGDYAFDMCDRLRTVTVDRGTPISITENVFSNRANATLYIPYGSKPEYEIADYWNQFKAINELPNPNAITVGSTGYATFCSPNAMDFTDVNGIKAYIASGFEPSTGTLVLTRAIKVPAGEGLYIVGTPGTYNVPETVTDMVYSNLLKGVTTATTISPTDGSNTNFILANGNYGVGFYTLSETGEIAAGKAYLQLPTASVSNVKAINFAFGDDSETGISEAKDVSEVKAVYNLQGQLVSQPKHGLYIINGKKVFIK